MSKTSVLGAGVLALAILAVALVQALRRSPTVSGQGTSAPHGSDEAAEDVPIAPTLPQGRRSEAPAGPESHERSLTILVIDEAGGPVREARVFASSGECEARRLGVTSAAGVVVCPEQEAPFTLVASGDDIQTREMLVERATPLVRMIVRRGARLSGRVVCAGSERPAPPGTRVVAWPSSWRVPPRELARRVQSADPRALATTVEGEGIFELSGLAPDSPYSILAVTPGWCVWPPVVLEASEDNILHMECVLGVRATVLELGGMPLGLPPLRSYGRRVPIENLEMRGARYVPRPNPIAELFGSGEGPESGDPTRMELLFTCPEELAMLGPIAFDVDIPGYQRESVDLWALPTDHGIAEQVVEALPSGEARRELRLEFEGIPSQASGRLAVRGKLGQIVLVDPEEHRRFVDLCDLSSRTMSLPGLPRSLRFEGVHLTAENPTSVPCELSSVMVEVESWRVDLSAFQAITVELLQPDDSQYLGPAVFLAGPSEDELGGPIFFERSPFVLLSKRAPDLCVFVFEPESFLIEPEVTPLEQPAILRKASIGWH